MVLTRMQNTIIGGNDSNSDAFIDEKAGDRKPDVKGKHLPRRTKD